MYFKQAIIAAFVMATLTVSAPVDYAAPHASNLEARSQDTVESKHHVAYKEAVKPTVEASHHRHYATNLEGRSQDTVESKHHVGYKEAVKPTVEASHHRQYATYSE
ncbi:hypothetical protein XANCAGTX0491_005796 [Xanthoria calcicola]